MNFLRTNLNKRTTTMLMSMMVVSFGIFLQSCDKDDDNELGARPSISLSTEQAFQSPGNETGTILTITAPEGLTKVNVLRNGSPYHTEEVSGNPKTLEWEYSYIVDGEIGSTINLTFSAVDAEDRASDLAVFEIRVTAKPIKEIPAGNLLGDHTWYSDTIYRINGFVRVGKDELQSGGTFVQEFGTLTIEPGTLIIGDKESKGTLIVQRGSKIFAEGTKEQPIVMTSEAPIGQRLPGDWGGLVMCGRVKNNQGPNIELEGGYGGYHGGTVELDDVNESSGVVRYVRIEYAGIPINPNEEVNTLTMGSVGKGTVIEYVMASYGLDDAFEWFGGSVDGKYLIAYHNLDDDFDVDFGYQGFVQFGLSIRGSNLADQSGSNGFEVDNNGQGTDSEPFTAGRFANITVIGPKKTRETAINTNFQHAAQLRRNSMLRIYNSFLTGYPDGIYIDDARGNSSAHAISDELRLRNVILAGVEGWGGNGFGSAFNAEVEGTVDGLPFLDADGQPRGNHPNAPRGISLKQDPSDVFNVVEWFNTPAYGNKRLAKWQDAGIDPTIFDVIERPGVLPLAGSMLLDAARWDNVPEADQFEQVPFSGAFGTVDWTEGWAEWLPGIQVYF
ncbi:MAG: Ig-like domain repeat protein [Bacteroidetes bacterium]|nr:MAG: Ig-like domain repeat protein [Bacteroidota bacterium]